MLTRRDAIRIGLRFSAGLAAIPAQAFSSKEFWNEKPPADWSSKEVQELLNKSPWAKEGSVAYNGGPGGAGGGGRYPRGGGGGGIGGIGGIGGGIPGLGGGAGGRRGGTGSGYPGGPVGGPQGDVRQFGAVVRWDSALPIREAMHAKTSDDPLKNYIIAVIGDMPSMGRRRDDDDEVQDERSLEMLKQYTKLERKGDPIFLDRTEATPKEYPSGAGTLFYFERRDSIVPDDKQVTFVTKMGPYEIKARFTLRDMLYHGKLEL